MDNTAELRLLALLTEIRDLLRARLPEPALADPRLEALLHAAALMLGDDSYSSVSLAQTSLSSFAGATALQKAIVAITGKNPDGGLRKLGRFLAANAGKTAGNYRLIRLKERDRYGTLYRVQVLRVSNPANPQASAAPRNNITNLKEIR